MNINKKKLLLASAFLLLVVAGVFTYWKLHQPTYKGDPGQRLPGVDYTPGTKEEKAETENKKQTGQHDTPSTQDATIRITYIVAAQDQPKGPLEIKVLLNNITEGHCDLNIKQGAKTITRQGNVIRQSNYYTCDGFNIEYAELSPGDWQVNTKVTTSTGRENAAETTTTIK